MLLGDIPGEIGRNELKSGNDTIASAYRGGRRWLGRYVELMYPSLKLHHCMKEHDRISVGWINRVGAFGVAEVLKHPCRSGPECSARSPLQAHELLLSALTACFLVPGGK